MNAVGIYVYGSQSNHPMSRVMCRRRRTHEWRRKQIQKLRIPCVSWQRQDQWRLIRKCLLQGVCQWRTSFLNLIFTWEWRRWRLNVKYTWNPRVFTSQNQNNHWIPWLETSSFSLRNSLLLPLDLSLYFRLFLSNSLFELWWIHE